MAHHHDCECGHDHHHEHEHESNSVQIDRYHEAFNKFEPALPDTQTTEAVNALLEKHFQENFTPEVLKTIHGCIDLTSLTSLDTKESIWKMVDTVNDFEGTRPDDGIIYRRVFAYTQIIVADEAKQQDYQGKYCREYRSPYT